MLSFLCLSEGSSKGQAFKKKKVGAACEDLLSFLFKYYLPALKKFAEHKFLYCILSKNHLGKLRRNFEVGNVWSQRDFAERLTLAFNQQLQQDYFGGQATISIEGVALEFYKADGTTKKMHFHTYFSDGKQQDSAVVQAHMQQMCDYLMK